MDIKKNNSQDKVWEPPSIHVHRIGAINKFGRLSVRDNVATQVFSVPIHELVQRFGSPLFVISEEKLRSNLAKTKSVFEKSYKNSVHAWSYKTNYISAVCRIMDQEGSLAEVVSAFEYEKARALGVPGDRIIFNGP